MTTKRTPTSVALVVAIFCLAGGSAASQELLRIDPRYYCAAEPGRAPESLFGFPPTAAAEEAVQEILDFVVIGNRGWRLWASSEDKASASMDPVTGERRIVYNEDFIDELRDESESVWANVAILAHEVAHHLSNHLETGDEERRRIEELEADRFAGYILSRKGASEGATRRVFGALGGGGRYPPVRDRVAAARNGWARGRLLGSNAADVSAILAGGVVAAAVDASAPGGDATVPIVSGLRLVADHGQSVRHEGGGQLGPGLRFRLRGRLQYQGPAQVNVAVHFGFPDGRLLFAHPQETFYRDVATGQVATGSARLPFSGGELDLSNVSVAALPYGVLNLGPVRYLNYVIVARASVYVGGLVVATSEPVRLSVVW